MDNELSESGWVIENPASFKIFCPFYRAIIQMTPRSSDLSLCFYELEDSSLQCLLVSTVQQSESAVYTCVWRGCVYV